MNELNDVHLTVIPMNCFGICLPISRFVFQMSGGHKKARPKGPVVQNPNSFRMERPPDGPPVELENQFILRLPQVNTQNHL